MSCLHSVSNTIGVYSDQEARDHVYAVVRAVIVKRIKVLPAQVVVTPLHFVSLPWLSLEISRKHFTCLRSMSLTNVKFSGLLRRHENLTRANQPVPVFLLLLGLEDLFFGT